MGRRGSGSRANKAAVAAKISTVMTLASRSSSSSNNNAVASPDKFGIKQIAKALDLDVSEAVLEYATTTKPPRNTREKLQRKHCRKAVTNYAMAVEDQRKSCHNLQVIGGELLHLHANRCMADAWILALEQSEETTSNTEQQSEQEATNSPGGDSNHSPVVKDDTVVSDEDPTVTKNDYSSKDTVTVNADSNEPTTTPTTADTLDPTIEDAPAIVAENDDTSNKGKDKDDKLSGFGNCIAQFGRRMLGTAFGRRETPGLISRRGFGFAMGTVPMGAIIGSDGRAVPVLSESHLVSDSNDNTTSAGTSSDTDTGTSTDTGIVPAHDQDNKRNFDNCYTSKPTKKVKMGTHETPAETVSDTESETTCSTSDIEAGVEEPIVDGTTESERNEPNGPSFTQFFAFADLAKLLFHHESGEAMVVVETAQDLKRLKSIMVKSLLTQPELQRVLSASALMREMEAVHVEKIGKAEYCSKRKGCRCENCKDTSELVVKALVNNFLSFFVRVADASEQHEHTAAGVADTKKVATANDKTTPQAQN